MLRLAKVTGEDVLYDLGCGDGRICIQAVRHFGCRATGVDIDLQRIHECTENARKAQVGDRARFLRASFFDVDISDATVVTLYLLPAINVRLRPKLLFDLKPGTRVVSNYFPIGDWSPDVTVHVHHRVLMLWIIPAWIAGHWEVTALDPLRAVTRSPRWRFHLDLKRKYQTVWGTARVGRDPFPILSPTLLGNRLTFLLYHPKHFRTATRFTGLYDGQTFRGTCRAEGGDLAPRAWGAVRAVLAEADRAVPHA